MEIVYILVGLCVGAVVMHFYNLVKVKDMQSGELLLKQTYEQTKLQLEEKERELRELTASREQLNDELVAAKVDLERALTQLTSERNQNSKEALLRQEQFEEQIKTLKEQFSNLATKVLESTGEKLKATNNEALELITKPLQQNLDQLQQAIKHTNTETARSTSALSEQLKTMALHTLKIDETANRLTNVIKGGNKDQGKWGERMLIDILDSQGLQRGVDYDIQQTITDRKGNAIINEDSGKKMIPDVILHYPNNEDIIIDSKMSIEAYYNYMNAETDAAKAQYAADLVRSIRNQANDLAKKDYSRYIAKNRTAVDFVIMFVPNEGALQLALAKEPKLWGEAFDKQVFITSQQNLLAVLKMIQMSWRQFHQTENQKRVFALAEELLKRVGDFIKRFDKVGTAIENLKGSYDEAYKKAYTGRQSVVQKANEIKELGVKESSLSPLKETENQLFNDDGKE